MWRKFILFSLVFFSLSGVWGQSSESVQMQQVLAAVEKNNLHLRMSEEAFASAQAQFRQTHSLFLPSVSLSHTAFTTDNPVMAFSAKLNQGIFSQADFDVNKLNQPDRIENFATAIEVQQPIINVDGFLKRASAKRKMEAVFSQNRFEKEALLLEAKTKYMELQWAYKQLDVTQKKIHSLKALKIEAENRFEQGLLLRSDVLMVEVQLTEAERQNHIAETYVKDLSDYIQFLMGRKSSGVLEPSDSLMGVLENVEEVVKLPADRPDLLAMNQTVAAYKKQYQSEKWSFLPTLNAFGNLQWFDDQIFNSQNNSYFVGAELKWQLFKGYQRLGKIQETKAKLEKATLENKSYRLESQNQLKSAYRQLDDARWSVELGSVALKQAQEQLRIQKNRYAEGLEKTTDILQAETQVAQKELAYYQAVYLYNTARAQLQFLLKS